ncbi:hypothetical protein [Halosimplex sp. J119]
MARATAPRTYGLSTPAFVAGVRDAAVRTCLGSESVARVGRSAGRGPAAADD